jgi:hypothetical protein
MTSLTVTIDEVELKKLVIAHLQSMSSVTITQNDVKIETKSKQNYKSEWESGAGFRATVSLFRP